MSAARRDFLDAIDGVRQATRLEALAHGAGAIADPPGVVVLRRGVLVASLIALETFIRDRTAELLQSMGNWPRSFSELPDKLREAALLSSLSNLNRYANMLRRNGEDYFRELEDEVRTIAATSGPTFGFSRHLIGDHTGNISTTNLAELLSYFQIQRPFEDFQQLARTIGFGVPSVRTLLEGLIRNRHRSAHVSRFSPSASDVIELPTSLTCLGICFDTALATTVEFALSNASVWPGAKTDWLTHLDIYFVDEAPTGYRLVKNGTSRALRLVSQRNGCRAMLPKGSAGRTTLLVHRDSARLPLSWELS